MSTLLKLYLFAYNAVQAIGWALSLFRILSNSFSTHSVSGAYASAGELICFLQSLAFLEVVHGAIGIVPSGVLFPLMQWGGRTHFLLAIVRRIHEVQELPSVFITFVAWSLSEVIRYSHYAVNCFGHPPYWITYLRYTAFIILYPIGVAPGEIWLMYQALPLIKEKKLYADFFFGLPFGYYRFVSFTCPVAIQASFSLYIAPYISSCIISLFCYTCSLSCNCYQFVVPDSADLLSIFVAETVPAHVQAEIIKTWKTTEEEEKLKM
ncbi:OLC1v1004196C1 [Oldenlandia corymbosa var. corymbosa]|uniref:Very-long-chain (3R)-3-hydroxyacyl-CoA dehydratase n=1 Tax=Oldenlandia corymbosa var. corymbosa TaxID=529605 RepID=A0AAV1DCI5_OLDCO|nr:OLC1v1004196C1 [Oldenlandia corymbosa var. corymbosa]